MMTKLHDLYTQQGQSVWIDYIRRQFIVDGGLQAAVDEGVRGVTSNPAIFDKAIAGSDDYDSQLAELVAQGKSVEEIYEAMAIEDIQMAADILRPIYDESDGVDGYISLEVAPTLANDTDGTIAEGRRLYAEVNRPNLMIKVPATDAGLPAIRTLISEGINVNVTLMFSLQDYDNVAEAYIAGLEDLVANDGDPSKVASVASFFVSRVESDMDSAIEASGNTDLLGKVAVANTKLAYKRFQETFSGERWQALADKGARVQRPLWASTSTKNDAYSDVKYVDELIGSDTVNTMPPETKEAFKDHGTVARTIDTDVDDAQATIDALADIGVDYDAITQNLQDVGVEKFEKPFANLLNSIRTKAENMAG
ncbi:MAG: transaldolase, partial [Chloroflexota bacterium]